MEWELVDLRIRNPDVSIIEPQLLLNPDSSKHTVRPSGVEYMIMFRRES